jgi:hypothetical protein
LNYLLGRRSGGESKRVLVRVGKKRKCRLVQVRFEKISENVFVAKGVDYGIGSDRTDKHDIAGVL